MQVILSRASAQSPLISINAKQRTCFFRVPPLGCSLVSSATADSGAVGAYDADIADGVGDVRLRTSLLVLTLTDLSFETALEITGVNSAYGTVPTGHSWRTCGLAVC